MRRVVLALAALTAASCFHAVVEVECVKNADCDAGLCLDGVCTAGSDGGVTGGGHHAAGGGAGSSGGGVGATGGGFAGAGPGGGTGSLGGGTGTSCTTGCSSVLGCQPGDSALACGTGGAQCATCNFGDQCVNGACMAASCGAQSCNGCCLQGICVPPFAQTANNCGANGTVCVQCPQGDSCSNGACQPMGCTGCLGPNGTCVARSAQSPQACGSNGTACMACPAGANCVNGACTTTPPTCANCNGCCDSTGTCRGGNNQLACGGNGSVCQTCGVGSTCMNRTCTPLVGGTDAGTGAHPVGAACTSSQQCQPPQGAQCIPETVGGQSTGYTGGYCTRQCGAQGCMGNAVCVTETVFGTAQSTCRQPCGGSTSVPCRQGYVCQATASGDQYCRPDCNNGGLLSACPQNQTCTAAGTCQ